MGGVDLVSFLFTQRLSLNVERTGARGKVSDSGPRGPRFDPQPVAFCRGLGHWLSARLSCHNATYRHDCRADKRLYPHDIDIQML